MDTACVGVVIETKQCLLSLRVKTLYISFITRDVTNDRNASIPVNIICLRQPFYPQWRLSTACRWECSPQRSLTTLHILVNNPKANYETQGIYLSSRQYDNDSCKQKDQYSNWQISPLWIGTCKIRLRTSWLNVIPQKNINTALSSVVGLEAFFSMKESDRGYLV